MGDRLSFLLRCHIVGLIILVNLLTFPIIVSASQWLTLTTDHFYIHFREQAKELADLVAIRAEEAHSHLRATFEHTLTEKIHVIIEDQLQQVNAYASPLYYNHVVLYSGFPTPYESLYTGFPGDFENWLEILLTHELTHIFQLDVKSQDIKEMIKFFGRVPYLSNPLLALPPLFIEGMAVMQESALPGGRGGNSYYDMFLRTAVLEDTLLELDQALGYYSFEEWQPAGASYLYGYSFLEFLLQEYPSFNLNSFNEKLATNPNKLRQSLVDFTGLDIAQLWWKWQNYTAGKYLDRIKQINLDSLTAVHPLEIYAKTTFYPAPNRLSEEIAYISSDGLFPALRLFNPKTGEDVKITALDNYPLGLSWDPRGRYLYLGILKSDHLKKVSPKIMRVDVTTSEITELEDLEGFAPTLSSDGNRLIFISQDWSGSSLQLVDLLNEKTQILYSTDDMKFTGLAWAPDCEVIAVSYWSYTEGSGVGIFDIAKGEFHVLVSGGGTYQFPEWSTDGKFLLFDSDLNGTFNIYAYEISSNRLSRLTNTLTGLFHPKMIEEHTMVALEYTSKGYRLVRLPFEPEKGVLTETRDVFSSEETATEVYGAVSKYSLWSTILPQFWLPIVKYSGNVTYLGAYTWGQDILGRTKYSLQTYLGLGNWQLDYNLQLEQNLDEAGNYLLYANFNRNSFNQYSSDPKVKDVKTSSMGVAWRGNHHYLSLEGVRTSVLANSGLTTVDYKGFISFETLNSYFNGKGPDHLGHLTLQIVMPLPPSEGWQFLYRQQVRLLDEKAKGTLLTGSIAYNPNKTSLGGEAGTFSLRGYPYNHFSGTTVGQLSVEGNYRLSLIERGFLDKPLMLKDISLYPFVDVGFAKTGGNITSGLGLGAELGINFLLGYGRSQVDWRLGLAWGVSESLPRIYMRIASGL